MKPIWILFFIPLFFLSCATDPVDDDFQRINEEIVRGDPEFNIIITDGSAPSFSGNQNSTWSPDIGLIVLRTNDDAEPVAQLIMEVRNHSELAGVGKIASAILTTSDVQVGTAEEINGKTYLLQEQRSTDGDPVDIILNPGFDATYAQAHYFTFQMERQIINQNDVEELITVSGSFTAKINE